MTDEYVRDPAEEYGGDPDDERTDNLAGAAFVISLGVVLLAGLAMPTAARCARTEERGAGPSHCRGSSAFRG